MAVATYVTVRAFLSHVTFEASSASAPGPVESRSAGAEPPAVSPEAPAAAASGPTMDALVARVLAQVVAALPTRATAPPTTPSVAAERGTDSDGCTEDYARSCGLFHYFMWRNLRHLRKQSTALLRR